MWHSFWTTHTAGTTPGLPIRWTRTQTSVWPWLGYLALAGGLALAFSVNRSLGRDLTLIAVPLVLDDRELLDPEPFDQQHRLQLGIARP